MVKIKYVLIPLMLIAAGIGAWFTLSQNEEKKIKKQFRLLSEGISKKEGENIFTMDQKIKKMGALFDDNCEIHLPAYSVSGHLTREEIIGYAARGRLHAKELHMKTHDLKIHIPEEGNAQAHLTVRLIGRLTTGETIQEAHEMVCFLKKKEKQWLLTRVEVVEVLKR